MFKEVFAAQLKEARESAAFDHYLDVREAVFAMLDNQGPAHVPSAYWREELAGFDYMLDASPLIIAKLREHCYHLTGIRSYDYRAHHRKKAAHIAAKLAFLRRHDRRGLLVPESPILGGFGYVVDGALYNLDTLKFYECLIALDQAGIISALADRSAPATVLEIGAGWGGFAYQFKTLFPGAHYVIVDFPAVLLFAATYLKTAFPGARVYLADGSASSYAVDPAAYDFLFIPHYGFARLSAPAPDLFINMVSFQEMTSAQVNDYLLHARRWGIRTVYSMNRDRSSNNDEIGAVGEIMARHFRVRELAGVGLQYTRLDTRMGLAVKSLKALVKRMVGKTQDKTSYRHLVGYA